MASVPAESSQSRKLHGKGAVASLARKINKMKKQIEAERVAFVKDKLNENKSKVESYGSHLLSLANTRFKDSSMHNNGFGNILSSRIENPLHLIPAIPRATQDSDNRPQEVVINVIAKLPVVEKVPHYITWTFLKRNRRMAENDSVNEQEIAKSSNGKHEFSRAEKHIIRMVCQDYEPSEEVYQILAQHIGGTSSEIQEIYNKLKNEEEGRSNQHVSVSSEEEHDMSRLLDKSLATTLDPFDTLFCRRCLVFNCSLHGNAQPVITPAERRQYSLKLDEDRQPCSDHCYLQSQALERGGSSNINNATTSGKCGVPGPSGCQWKPLEVDLFLKGCEIFGQNSCLITRNVLSRLKTCSQVYNYMQEAGPSVSQRLSTALNANRRNGVDHKEQEIISTPKEDRRKGKPKKLQHSSEQYTSCECKSMCGKGCPCIQNHTSCEKYCGCPKGCKYRFMGCLCRNGECRSQNCVCFATGRECDPDLCRNCWVSCGDGSLGEPSKRGECGECSNMRLTLNQHRRILLAKSDVAGWGAFLKNSVNEDEYLGEYTGEMISHQEADLRGIEYVQKDTSYLFDVNDQQVLDGLRSGNKLKFANHSPNPNCYAKLVKAKNDPHVAIFAKEPIEAGQELFLDYGYRPDIAPAWAKKPDEDEDGDVDHDGPKQGSSAPRSRTKKQQ